MDPDTLESQQPARDEVTGEVIGKVYKESRVPPPAADRTGLKAAQTALDLLRSTSNPPADLMTETLIELGDWFQATSRPQISIPYYAEAAGILDAQVAADPLAGHPLKAPRMVFYRPPLSASRGLNTLSGQYVIRKTVFTFVVTETGLPLDITVVSTDMDEGQLSQSKRAVGRAIYSPRFAEGHAVSTAGRHLHQRVVHGIRPGDGVAGCEADLDDARATATGRDPGAGGRGKATVRRLSLEWRRFRGRRRRGR